LGDLSLTKGYSLTQPTIRPLFDTKQLQDVNVLVLQVSIMIILKASSASFIVDHLGTRFT
jgi:molybdopterin-containing oxidoreductase family iron-sulfur binding subunit